MTSLQRCCKLGADLRRGLVSLSCRVESGSVWALSCGPGSVRA